MSHSQCPDCERPLNFGQTKCRCGWQAEPERETRQSGCHWSGCPMPGSMSDNTRGGGPFFCRWHHWTRGDPRAADQITEQMRRGEITLEKRDWRDRMMDDLMAGRLEKKQEMEKQVGRHGYLPPDHGNENELLDSLKGLYGDTA